MLGPRAWYLEFERLIIRVFTRIRRSGSRCARTALPMAPTRSMTVSAMTPAALVIWSRAVFRVLPGVLDEDVAVVGGAAVGA